MFLRSRSLLSRSLLAGLALSSVGAKGCFGGDVSLGNDGTAGSAGSASNGNPMSSGGGASSIAGAAATGGGVRPDSQCELSLNPPPCTVLSLGYSFDPQQGKCVPRCSNSANFASLEGCQMACQAASGGGGSGGGASATEAPLTLGTDGHVRSSAAFGVSGPFYPISDAAGVDGSSATGDCELAGHSVSQCANVITPPYDTAGLPDWSVGGLMCTSGIVEGVVDVADMPGTKDYEHMWGSGLAFNFIDDKAIYDASSHGVIGLAFDLDQVPPRGVRVELLTPATVNRPAAWQPTAAGFTSPVHVGRNVVLFQDVVPLPFYADQSSFDPSQIVSVQFHVPTTNDPAGYAFCVSNLALVLGTPPAPTDPVHGACPPSLETDSGFAYQVGGACVDPNPTVLGCSTLDTPATAVPAAPAIANLPCVRRLSDGKLFIALSAATQPLDWQTLPPSAWSHLSPTEWAECNAGEAALVAAASVCPILPI